ncbi:hypothetical protein [Phormidium nigroviride]
MEWDKGNDFFAIAEISQDLRTQPKKPGFLTKILRLYPQILSKTRFQGFHSKSYIFDTIVAK